MERSHRQLRTRLADGLRRDNADSFADIDRCAARQIAPVAGRADAVFAFACQYRTDFDLFDAGFFNFVHVVFVNQLAFRNQNFAVFRIEDVFLRRTAEDALADGGDNVAAVNDRTDDNAAFGAAVGFGNDDVLRHVNQTAGQVTGVRGLQRRIGQTFARTVRRAEVLGHRQAFFKV